MKLNLLRVIIASTGLFLHGFQLQAQTITIIGNPTKPSSFTASNNGGALSGYAGAPVLFNNTLVLQYNATGTSGSAANSTSGQTRIQLAVYNGSAIDTIANPDAGVGVYLQQVTNIVYNNKLYFIYIDVNSKQRLASFDGTSITLYPNPDAGLGYVGSPRIFNGVLYGAINNASGVYQFAKFTGTGWSFIANPDNSTVGFNYNYAYVFNNKLVARYITASGDKHLTTFDGTSWTILANPDNTSRGVVPAFPIAYKNKLYWQYFSAANQYQLLQYDGVNNPTLIANPTDASSNQGGYAGFPIVLGDTLFLEYQNTTNAYQLAKFDGTTETLVPNPDNTTYGFYNTPIVYNNGLYIFYVTPDGLHHLAQYQPASNSLKIYPNPDGGNGYWDQPIVYKNNLYFQYYNASGTFQLGYFNEGNSLNLIPNPSGVYNSIYGNNGYTGNPILFNNLLYMQFGSVPYGDAGNLAYFDGSALPVTLLNFTAQAQSKTALLQWKTANETNNAYFEVERSADGTSFTSIGKVNGHGSSAIQQQYSFVDNSPLQGDDYYRLKQVDLTGKATYSAIKKVSFDGTATALHVYPNPAKNTVVVTLPTSALGSVVTVFDMNGRRVMQKQIGANTSSQTLDVSGLAAGKYQLQWLPKNGKPQTVSLVKQ